MLRRMFMKGLLASPVALLGGKEERFVAKFSDDCFAKSGIAEYDTNSGARKKIILPKGMWQAKEIIFTRVGGES